LGRNFIDGLVKTQDFNKWARQAREQAAYEHGHSYSGHINMLDDIEEYTEYQFNKDFKVPTVESIKEEWEFMGKWDKISARKTLRILKTHNAKEVTFQDFKDWNLHKKIPKWKIQLLNEGWRAASDILYYIPFKDNKYYWFGYAMC
jgi:hypothetical protein